MTILGCSPKIFPPLMNKFITGCRKSNYLFYSVDGDISPCLFLQQPIGYIVNYDSFIRQIHEADEDNIDIFPFLETDLLYLLYGLPIVYTRCRFQKHKIFYFLKVKLYTFHSNILCRHISGNHVSSIMLNLSMYIHIIHTILNIIEYT